MRPEGRLKMGYFPIPIEEAERLQSLLVFPEDEASVVDPCVGTGDALLSIAPSAQVRRYGVELDSGRAKEAASKGIEVIQGNVFETSVKVGSFSLLYLNPPYDSEIAATGSERMEKLFLSHSYRWLIDNGILILVIPHERLMEISGILSSHFDKFSIFRLSEPEAVRFHQIAIIARRAQVTGKAIEATRDRLLSLSRTSIDRLPKLTANAEKYLVPPSSSAVLNYRGLPFDELEDLLPGSSAWRQAATCLLPKEETVTGRPITPLHGGHVGLLCTAGLLNGVFGEGEDRHIARWRSLKHRTVYEQIENDEKITRTVEYFSHELLLVFEDGRTMKLTDQAAEESDDGKCTPATGSTQV